MKKAFSILFAMAVLVACKNDSKKATPILADSTGSVKQVLLVIDNDLWKGDVGDALRKIISEPVVGLPQPEPQFAISRVPTDAFGSSMLKRNRTILYIEKRETDAFHIAENKYAQPQKIISILGKSNASIISQLNKNAKKILKEFNDLDIKVVQNKLKKKAKNRKPFKTFEKLGIEMTIPKSFTSGVGKDTGNFLWLSQDMMKGSESGVLVYAIPITNEEDELGNTIINNRNAIGKEYISGEKEGMYMITEKAYTPYRYDAIIDGKKAYETRGKWEMKDDFMAGPFLNYTVIDKANNRLIVVEGFVFAPAVDKRNYMFELEAILKTLRIK